MWCLHVQVGGVLSVMMPEAGQSVLGCDQLCGSRALLLNSLGTLLPQRWIYFISLLLPPRHLNLRGGLCKTLLGSLAQSDSLADYTPTVYSGLILTLITSIY